MEWMNDLVAKQIFDISLKQYGLAFLAILAGFVLKRLSASLMERLLKVTEKTRFRFDQVIVGSLSKPLGWAFMLGGLYVASLVMPIPEEPVNVRFFVNSMLKSLSIFVLIWAGIRLVDQATEVWLERATKTDTKLDDQFIPVVRNATKVFLWMVGGVLFLQNMGYSVTSLIAGLGSAARPSPSPPRTPSPTCSAPSSSSWTGHSRWATGWRSATSRARWKRSTCAPPASGPSPTR